MSTRAYQTNWQRHPAVRSGDQLTFGERAADAMRRGMGSWPFVFCFFGVMIGWAVTNTIVLSRSLGSSEFDPYPYILLNLFLSMLAGVQAAALLIAAKRADAISSELAMHDYQTDQARHSNDAAQRGALQYPRHQGAVRSTPPSPRFDRAAGAA